MIPYPGDDPMFTRYFWTSALERAVKTAAQSVLLAVGADQGFDALTADWATIGGFALGGAVLSILSSMASTAVSDPESPSIV